MIWSSHPNQINKTAVFKTAVTVRADNKNGWKFPGYPYEIVAAS